MMVSIERSVSSPGHSTFMTCNDSEQAFHTSSSIIWYWPKAVLLPGWEGNRGMAENNACLYAAWFMSAN